MKYRIEILRKYKINFDKLENLVKEIKPFPYAKTFLKIINKYMPIILVSGAPYELLTPVINKMGNFFTIANNFILKNNKIIGFNFRIKENKEDVVNFFKRLNYKVIGIGDSFNDISMLKICDYAFLLRPSEEVKKACRKLKFKYKLDFNLKEIEKEISKIFS